MLKDFEKKVVLLAAGKWFVFGLQLDIKPEALDAIKTPNGSNKEHCLEMFKCWLAKVCVHVVLMLCLNACFVVIQYKLVN